MKKPYANTSPEAIALREAALAFAAHGTPNDRALGKSKAAQQANAALLQAAMAYAAVVHEDSGWLSLDTIVLAGKWCTEMAKGVRLYIAVVDNGQVQMSYRPGDPIAVRATLEDFHRFFEVE